MQSVDNFNMTSPLCGVKRRAILATNAPDQFSLNKSLGASCKP